MKFWLLLVFWGLLLVSHQTVFAQEESTASEEVQSDLHFFEQEEFTQRTLPFAMQQQQTGFWEKIQKLLGKIVNFQCILAPVCQKKLEKNSLSLSEAVAGDKGFGQSFTLYSQQQKEPADLSSKLKLKTERIKKATLPYRLSVVGYDSSTLNTTFIQPQGELQKILTIASTTQCVPQNLLIAFANRESGLLYKWKGLSTEEINEKVKFYSTPGWWTRASKDQLLEGNCYNTCDTVQGCPAGADVKGVMQFEAGTWGPEDVQDGRNLPKDSIAWKVREALLSRPEFSVPENYVPHRCNLRDSIIAAAIKIRNDGGVPDTQCNSVWPKHAVEKAAGAYCSCNPDEVACTPPGATNYCTSIIDEYYAREGIKQ